MEIGWNSQKLLVKFAILWAMILGGSFIFGQQHVAAASNSSAEFQVKAIPPEQQTTQNTNFFSFDLAHGQTAQLGLTITNNSNATQTFKVKPTVGVTNDQGTVLYSDTSKTRDSSLKLDFTKLGPEVKTITVAAGQTGTYTTSVTIPENNFTGAIVGGFYINSPSLNEAAMKKKSKKNSVSIRNVYSYAIGALINVGDVSTIQPNFRIRTVKPTVVNQKGAVVTNIQNFNANYVSGRKLAMTARVYKRGSTEKLFDNTVLNMNFAPNSNMNLPVSWGNTEMEAGNYTMKVTITRGLKSDMDHKVWHLTKNFTITPAQASRANQNPNLKKNYMWLIILLVVVLVLLVSVLLVYVYKRGKQTNTSAGKPQQRRKRKK